MPLITKFGRLGIYNKELPSINPYNRLFTCPLRSREILDLLYLWFNNIYVHQIRKGGDFPRKPSTDKVKKLFEDELTQ